MVIKKELFAFLGPITKIKLVKCGVPFIRKGGVFEPGGELKAPLPPAVNGVFIAGFENDFLIAGRPVHDKAAFAVDTFPFLGSGGIGFYQLHLVFF